MKHNPAALSAILLSAASLYFFNLPQYVQGGDTGELVAAGYRLLVAHPPGYPLWIWLVHFVTHALPMGSVFWRASFLSGLLSCGVLLVIGLPLLSGSLSALFLIAILALSRPFMEAALLPDVFALHALFVAAIGSCYLFAPTESRRFQWGVSFLFALGLSNHLTLVFLFPVLIGVLLETRKIKISLYNIFCSGTLGVCLSLGLYGSMLTFHPESAASWGLLDGVSSIWHHFLRSDYGTLKLVAQESHEDAGGLAGIGFFFQSQWLELCGILGIGVLAVLNGKKKFPVLFNSRAKVWGVTCILGIAFFLASNIKPQGMGEEVLRRFCVMPLVQLTLLSTFLVSNCGFKASARSAAISLALVVVIVLGSKALDIIGLRSDSAFEDYAINLLVQADRHKPALVITPNDNSFMGMRYVQEVLSKDREVGVVTPSLLFHPWYLRKVQMTAPGFKLSDPEKIWSARHIDLPSDLIAPNIQKFSVIVPTGYQDGKTFNTTFLGLGRLIRQGQGLEFDEASLAAVSLRTVYERRPVGLQSFSRGFLYSEYSYFYLARGLYDRSSGQTEKALEDMRSALERVPFAYPALINLCNLKHGMDSLCSEESVEAAKREGFGFF